MSKIIDKSYEKINCKLIQAESIAKILLNNINTAYGQEEPFLATDEASNLAWTLIDLICDSRDEIDCLELVTDKLKGDHDQGVVV